MPTTVNRGVAIANASHTCVHCYGGGLLQRGGVCRCVLRVVFRICFKQYRYSSENSVHLNRCCVTEISRGGRILTGLPHAEYVVDFERAATRALSAARYKLFRLHFVEGREYSDCLAKLRLNRGNFFHESYRVEEQVGAQCLKGLYPLYEYFGVRRVRTLTSAPRAAGGLEVPSFHHSALMAAA